MRIPIEINEQVEYERVRKPLMCVRGICNGSCDEVKKAKDEWVENDCL